VTEDELGPEDVEAIVRATGSTLLARELGEAVIVHRITASAEVLALTEGALNLLRKAEKLLQRGTPEERSQAVALIERALGRLPHPSDVTELPDVREHVDHMHQHAADLLSLAAHPPAGPLA
jgi:hypothetical protein